MGHADLLVQIWTWKLLAKICHRWYMPMQKKRPRAQDKPVEISKLSWQFLSDNGFKVKKDICFKCVTRVDNSWVKKSNCPKVYMHGTYILL